jgi:hypothetical protein
MRRLILVLLSLAPLAFAGKKVEFNAEIHQDITCELGYRVYNTGSKGKVNDYCIIGPKGAAGYLAQNVGNKVNIKGHDGIQNKGNGDFQVLWVNSIAGHKVKDDDPCNVSGWKVILTAGATLPPQCTQITPLPEDTTAQSAPADSSPAQYDPPVYNAPEKAQVQQQPYPQQQQQQANHYVEGYPQCVVHEYQTNGGTTYLINRCNMALTVKWTSDSGVSWGQTDIGPNARVMIASAGIGYSRRDGNIWTFACPAGTQPVDVNGSPWLPNNYKGGYRCYQQ